MQNLCYFSKLCKFQNLLIRFFASRKNADNVILLVTYVVVFGNIIGNGLTF